MECFVLDARPKPENVRSPSKGEVPLTTAAKDSGMQVESGNRALGPEVSFFQPLSCVNGFTGQ